VRDRGEFVSRGSRFRPVSRIFDYPLQRRPAWEFVAGGRIYITGLVSDVWAPLNRSRGKSKLPPNKNDDCFSVSEIDAAPISRSKIEGTLQS